MEMNGINLAPIGSSQKEGFADPTSRRQLRAQFLMSVERYIQY